MWLQLRLSKPSCLMKTVLLSFRRVELLCLIIPGIFLIYILVVGKYTENKESARNIDCSVLHLSMWCGVILFLEICCTIWSKTNNVLLSKRQWNIITKEALLQRITWRQHKSRRKLLLGLQFCHYGLFCAEDNLLQFFSLHDFSKKRGEILLTPRFLN